MRMRRGAGERKQEIRRTERNQALYELYIDPASTLTGLEERLKKRCGECLSFLPVRISRYNSIRGAGSAGSVGLRLLSAEPFLSYPIYPIFFQALLLFRLLGIYID